ncbi:MAG: cytochrome C [Bacteroidetes bacterium]|nr:cytochrome C [Bacteroidota bacterium]
MDNLLKLISKPDNVAIVIMLILITVYTVWAFRQAIANDRRKRLGKHVEGSDDKKLDTWPNLVRIEMLVAMVVIAGLIVWSIVLDAPLEEHSNPSLTPNPAKAPWYFLGLQEMLVYFDPWIAGVIFPILIIFGLMAIPYLDINPKGNGYYTFSERKNAILIFCFGFLVLWILLIVIGVFMRGPGWLWYWPWEEWDHNRVIYKVNVDLTQYFGIDSRSLFGFLIGGSVVILYFGLGMILPYYIWKKRNSDFLKKLGMTRYIILSFLFCAMIGLPIKIILTLTLNMKYIWVTPWFNI